MDNDIEHVILTSLEVKFANTLTQNVDNFLRGRSSLCSLCLCDEITFSSRRVGVLVVTSLPILVFSGFPWWTQFFRLRILQRQKRSIPILTEVSASEVDSFSCHRSSFAISLHRALRLRRRISAAFVLFPPVNRSALAISRFLT